MNKGDLISKIATDAGITKAQATAALSAVTNGVAETLKKGDKVSLVGFGTFSTKHRPEATRPNPLKKGTMMTIAEKTLVKFKAGKALEEAVN